jgi:hypothetical protein
VGGELKLTSIYKGRQVVSAEMEERTVWWRDESMHQSADGSAVAPVITEEHHFVPHDFRAGHGAMAVDNAFSFSAIRPGTGGGADQVLHADIWLRAKVSQPCLKNSLRRGPVRWRAGG